MSTMGEQLAVLAEKKTFKIKMKSEMSLFPHAAKKKKEILWAKNIKLWALVFPPFM